MFQTYAYLEQLLNYFCIQKSHVEPGSLISCGGKELLANVSKNRPKNSKKKNHIRRTMCYCKYNYIFQKRCLCTKHDKQTYQQTLPKKQKHLAKLMPDNLCKKIHVLYLENANIEEHCLIKFSSKMCHKCHQEHYLCT